MSATEIVSLALSLSLLAVKVWALGDAATRPAPGFKATGTLDKAFWLIILAIGFGVHFAAALQTRFLGGWGGFFGIAGIVAALVYLYGIRPKLVELGPRKRGGGGSSSDRRW